MFMVFSRKYGLNMEFKVTESGEEEMETTVAVSPGSSCNCAGEECLPYY